MSSGLYQIEKLDDDNYDGWKVHMKSVLIHSELWTYVSGTTAMPEAVANQAPWKAKDEKALATILLSVKTSQLLHVKNCKSSSEAWKKLEEVHSPRGPARKVTLFKNLLNLKMSENTTMASHLHNFFDLFEKITEVDIKLQDELLTVILLSSLPQDYENFVIAMESRDELPTALQLKTKLIEESKRREGEKTHEGAEMAFFSKRSQQKRSPQPQKNRTVSGKCYKCHKHGHYASSCRLNKAGSAFAMLNACSSVNLDNNVWVLDSGSTCHMCCDKAMFTSLKPHKEKIELPADKFTESDGIGQVSVKTKTMTVTLLDVLYVPSLKTNFISMSKVTNNNKHTVRVNNKNAVIYNSAKQEVLSAEKIGNLFLFYVNKPKCFSLRSSQDIFMKWHRRYGHLNAKSLSLLFKKEMVRGLDLMKIPDVLECETCLKGKISNLPFPKYSNIRSSDVLEVVHSDICGPMRTTSLGGYKYFAFFIDDFSRKIFVYFLKHKSDILDAFKIFKAQVECETSKKIKVLRTDNGSEYVNGDFDKFLKLYGIQRQLTVQYTPQQNGVAERANRTVVEMARCMLMDSELPESLWGEAVNTAVYLRNRSPTKILEYKTPYEVWCGNKPAVDHFKVFGCKAIMLDKRPGKSKFNAKGISSFMVGYSSESKAYRLYEPKTKKIHKCRDVKFLENIDKNISKNSNDCTILDLEEPDVINPIKIEEEGIHEIPENVNEENTESSVSGDETPTLKMNLRPRKPNANLLNNVNNNDELLCNPNTVEEVFSRKDAHQWFESMEAEYNSLLANDTWELVNLPANREAIKSKWVFNIKRDKNGKIVRYKSRLVAKGCSQKYGVDFNEVFSPVVRYSSIRLILALAAEYNLEVHQMDVAAAYLNGKLKEEIFMIQPEKFVDPKNPEKVCKLKKALYGLKQAGREWNETLDKFLHENGFTRCNGDTCVYIKNKGKEAIIVAVYVDDILIACSNLQTLNKVKYNISLKFDVVDKGPVDYFLGMEVVRDKANNTISICQQRFIQDLLEEFKMVGTRKCNTPLDPGQKFKKCSDCTNCEKIDTKLYQSLIGSLMYLGLSTRPDIMHSVSKLSQFNVNPHKEHFGAAKHLLRYLNSTKNFKLIYRKTGESLTGFADADWASSSVDRKSYTGFTFIIADAAITWESRKQSSVALSSTEAEYMALSSASKEAVYLRDFIKELGFVKLIEGPTELFGDNISAQQLVKNPVYHARSKHIDIRFHYIREVFEKNLINISYVPTDEMTADILTKNLNKIKHAKLSHRLGLSY